MAADRRTDIGGAASTTAPPKPFSAACERNREPILAVLRVHFAGRHRVLEIGSGTGQHAAYFSAALPHLTWQASDRAENLPGIRLWLDEAQRANTPATPLGHPQPPGHLGSCPAPLEFDVDHDAAPRGAEHVRYDAVFSANTLHIMSWPEVERLFARLPALTTADATLVIYGPFNVAGEYTSPSNAAFDRSLKARAPHMGIRDAEAVDALARAAGFDLIDDIAMPANNSCRVWRRSR